MPGIHMIRLEACMSVHSCTSPSSSFPIRLLDSRQLVSNLRSPCQPPITREA